MSVRSASRGSPAARSIRLALRTSSIVATSSANFFRWVLRWFGSQRLSSELMLSAISVMPFMSRFQGPPRAKALNHKPTPHVNSLPAELIDGKDLHLFIAHRFRVVELGMKIPDDFSLIGSQHFNLRRLASCGPLRSLWPRRFNRWFPLPFSYFIAT